MKVSTCTHFTVILADHSRLRRGYLEEIINITEMMLFFQLPRGVGVGLG